MQDALRNGHPLQQHPPHCELLLWRVGPPVKGEKEQQTGWTLPSKSCWTGPNRPPRPGHSGGSRPGGRFGSGRAVGAEISLSSHGQHCSRGVLGKDLVVSKYQQAFSCKWDGCSWWVQLDFRFSVYFHSSHCPKSLHWLLVLQLQTQQQLCIPCPTVAPAHVPSNAIPGAQTPQCALVL